jgi:hypothetical protein
MPAWLSPRPWDPQAVRTCRRWTFVAVVVFALATWFLVPHGIGYSWRECDTQSIARNFLLDGFDPLHPRVDWRGDTAGYVECEFPLYQLMIATSLAGLGDLDAEWPGRLIALLAVMAGAIALQRLLELRSGPAAGLVGALAFLATGSAALMATRVMPDALSFALGVLSLAPFVRYLATGSGLALALSALALTAAGLQKPPALQLGAVMFGWAALLAPARLRDWRLWLAFVVIVGTVGAWLVHGKNLYEATGLSFGVTAGDTKFPAAQQLLSPKVYANLAWTTVQHGFSLLAGAALLFLGVRKRLDRADLVLLTAVALGLLLSLRYSYHHGIGPHYHAFAAFAGAWCLGRAWPAAGAPRWLWAVLLVAVAAHGGWRLLAERSWRTATLSTPLVELAASVRPQGTGPAPLAIVRGDKAPFDTLWQRRTNFEDPRFFYQSRLRGWALHQDELDVARLTELHGLGGRVVCDMAPGKNSPEVERWLAAHGELLADRHGVRLHRLHDRL